MPTSAFCLGGLVVDGQRPAGYRATAWCSSALTDRAHEVPVRYQGILPDLFREGQGIVAQGVLGEDGVFTASEVSASTTRTLCRQRWPTR